MKMTALLALCAAALLVGCSSGSDSSSESTDDAAPPATAPSGGAKLPAAGDVQLAAFEKKPAEIGCGMCIYKMDGVNGCKTAAVIDGKPMLVTGAHANAHALGLCGSAKQALVTGAVVGDEVRATSIELQ